MVWRIHSPQGFVPEVAPSVGTGVWTNSHCKEGGGGEEPPAQGAAVLVGSSSDRKSSSSFFKECIYRTLIFD